MTDHTAAGPSTAEAGPADDTEPPVPTEIRDAARTRAAAASVESGPAEEADRGAPRTQGGPSAVLKGRPGFREPPEDYIRAAKVAPSHWLSMIDRHWDGDEGEVPPGWAVLGRWRSDERGEIVEWEENTEYRPSPDAHGWAPPVSPADAAVQLVATGYAPEELLALCLADAEVAVCLDGQGGLAVTEAPDGAPAVLAFSTSPGLDGSRLPPHEVMAVPDLLDRLPEGKEVLFLSSSAPVGQLVTVSILREGMATLERFEEETDDEPRSEPAPAADRPDTLTELPGLAVFEDWPDFMSASQPTDDGRALDTGKGT